MVRIVDDHGRPIEALDVRLQGQPSADSFAVTTMTGVPIYGRHVPGSAPRVWMIDGWYACCELPRPL